MRLGLGQLRLSPSEFWSMTPRELEAAIAGCLGPASVAQALTRTNFAALMQRFPD